MTQQTINIGTVANDGTGDTARVAFDKVNDNFGELYSLGYIAPTPTGVASTDTDAFQAWVTACGANAVLNLVPGTTLTLDEGIQLYPGQKLRGNGATITRTNQVATTTDTDVTSGVTTAITVASTTGLRVGQTIALQVGAATNYSAPRTISDITGSVVTVSSAFNITSTTNGINVYLVFHCFTTDDDVEISGVTFDGNRSNWTFNRWDQVIEVRAAGNRVKVIGNTFKNTPCEAIEQVNVPTAAGVSRATSIAAGTNAITAAGTTAVVADASIFAVGDYVTVYTATTAAKAEPLAHRINTIDTGTNTITIDAPGWWFAESSGTLTVVMCASGQWFSDNQFLNVGGNPIHTSGSVGTQIARNTMINVNLDTNAGHRGGGVSWSFATSHAIVSDNYINGCYTGFMMEGIFPSGATISGNIVENATAYGLFVTNVLTTAYATRDVTVIGNTFRNCVQVYCGNSGATTDATCYVQNFVFKGNRLYRTEFYTDRIIDAVIEGNYVYAETPSSTSTNRCMDINRAIQTVVANNVCVGGYYGIIITNTGIRVAVRGNQCSYQYTASVYLEGTVGVVADGNHIMSDSTAAATYAGIQMGSGCVARNNIIRSPKGYGILVSGSSANSVVQGNFVKAEAGQSIRIASGCTGYVVTDNAVSTAITDSPAVGLRVANNDTVTMA